MAGKRPLKTLERILSKAGVCSRTEAKRLIEAGRVSLNGRIVTSPDQWLDPGRDVVSLDGHPVKRGRRLYLLLYKPTGYITTRLDPQGRKTVYDLIGGVDAWVFPVGRLDQDTSGLLILTNDTAFAERMTNPEFKVPKTYLVKTTPRLDDGQLGRLREGLELKDGPTRPAEVKRLRDSGNHTFFEITITEGRNRQVRRMMEAIGATTLKLVRTAIGDIRIDSLTIGSHRELTPEEIRTLSMSRSND